jgi:hypothetical protein
MGTRPWVHRTNCLQILAAYVLLLAPSIAVAKCPDPGGPGYAPAAVAQFRCSSARQLMGDGSDREFRIKLDFPNEQPVPTDLPWKKIRFDQEPEAYLRALLAYGIQDNSDPAIDWRIEDNIRTRWCHAPWFHNQRERLHGMTLERGSRLKELHEAQLTQARNWAVGFYNDIGCYALGRVWKDPSFPKTNGFAFPDGAFSIKLLFTTASLREVPYLTGSKEWRAAINDDGSIERMRLLQVDVAVRDTNADSFTGWLFGTFIYDAYAPGETVWEKLVPVGLMWGNDPDLTSAQYEERGRTPQQAWLNPEVAKKFFALPRHNLGLHGRVNGPVDNSKAACLGCHGRALDWGRAVRRGTPAADEANLLLPLAPSPYVDEAVRNYFRNLKPNVPFVAGTQPLDFSLQLAGGIANFRAWVAQAFPQEANKTSDVPPYKFKSDGTPSPATTELMRMLKRGAAELPRASDSGAFVRGED